MTRLQTEYQRLYLSPDADVAAPTLNGSDGQVRAMVLALCGPADWARLAPVWRGVQADLGWPAPAIAVNGVDAFELWFSLVQPVPLAEATACLQGLRERYLAEVKPGRVRLWPGADAAPWTAPRIPAQQAPERWSAFVAPDLAAVFGGDDPSLDFQPGDDAQAELLSRLASIPPAEWPAALAQLQPAEPAGFTAMSAPAAPPTHAPTAGPAHTTLNGPYPDPRRFLLDVMNDPSVALALRIEAAKALLPVAGEVPR
ncbi:MAG: hypothetical protein Q7U52_04065 [Hydrogenophaga sp.]|uniref:hypothetical protein n=1 Tax=Hydrogenophaga sp. TaxID=1904254 RepID=UPI00272835BB|nr:hypothetical protein [Hydrogenophaga sp.]MDO9146832.1 hypothetical protein [Hydrogenophaga sp.]MDO9603992.1 hypothetical protein [Hydrogenophaga sp.]